MGRKHSRGLPSYLPKKTVRVTYLKKCEGFLSGIVQPLAEQRFRVMVVHAYVAHIMPAYYIFMILCILQILNYTNTNSICVWFER